MTEQAMIDREAGYRLLGELAGADTIEGTLAPLDSLAPGFADWIGMEPREIVEVMVHLAPYLGVPRALAGVRVVADVLRSAEGSGTDGGTGTAAMTEEAGA